MAITQQRIISIINAGLDFKQALDRTIQLIDDEYARYAKHDDIPPFLVALYTRCSYIKLLEHYDTSPAILAIEAKHFRSNWRRNQRNAAKAERRRREAGMQPKASNNDPFIRTPAAPQPRLDTAFISRPNSYISPEREAAIRAEADAALRRRSPELFANEQPQDLAAQMGEAYDPDDPENQLAQDQPIVSPEAGTASAATDQDD